MGKAVVIWRVCTLLAATILVSTASNDDPPIPEIWNAVKESFDSDVLVTMGDLEPGAAFLVDERYEILEQLGSMEILDHGSVLKYYYYSNTDQSFLVQGTKCTVGTLESHPGYSMWGWDYTSGNDVDNYVFGPSALLKMTEEYRKQITYEGVETIRNISADHWHLQLEEQEYAVHYYFAVDGWTMPYGKKIEGTELKSPLRVTVVGKEGNPWNPSEAKKVQTVTYDYLEFQPYVLKGDFRKFLPERGIDCKNRKTMNPKETTPPDPYQNLKMHMEAIYNKSEQYDGIVFKAWLHYDAPRQLMRLDMDNVEAVYKSAPMSNVQDMATGIEYSINQWTGECKIKTWSKSDFAALVGAEIADVIMADKNMLFKLDDKYIFAGFDETRAIKTARWTATRNDIDSSTNPGKQHKKVVVDYQFLSTYVDDIGEYTTSPLPVRIDITIYKDEDQYAIFEKQTLNLLHVQTAFASYELNPFNVGNCFTSPVSRSWYKIFFKGHWNQGAAQNQDDFKKDIIEKLNNQAKVSYVRLPTVELDHDEFYVYAHVLVLEPASYLLQFKSPTDEKPWTGDEQMTYNIQDDRICAAMCLNHKKVGYQCLSFYQCEGTARGRNCFISNYKNARTPAVTDVKNCQHYVLAANSPDFQEPNIGVLAYLVNSTLKRQFNFSYSYKDELGFEHQGVFEGVFVEDEAYPGDPVFLDYYVDDFHISARHSRLKDAFTHIKKTTSYDDCKISCNVASGYDCQSFSFCYDKNVCYLSEHVTIYPINKKDIVADGDCVIMSRRYTSDYTSIKGAVYVSKPKQTFKHKYTAQECAYLCDNATDFVCRSFDMCYDKLTCNLYTERSVDIPDEKINKTVPFCDHFERNSLVDFEKHEKKVLDGNRDRFVDDVSVTDCADICEQEPDYGCNGFDYCAGPPATCFLTSAHYGDDGITIHSKPDCDHYSREYYDGDDWNHYSHTKTSKYKYGPGAMAGLGVSMLVISIALTLGGVYIYNTRR